MPSESGRSDARRADPLDLSVLERSAAFDRLIAVSRVGALVFYVVASVVEPGDDLALAVVIGIALALGSALGLLTQRTWRSRPFFGTAMFVFDGMIITLILTNSVEDPFNVGYAAAFLVVFEGARWGRRGGVLGGLWMGMTVAAWTAVLRDRAGLPFVAEPMLQRLGVFVIVGWAMGSMIHRLQQQRSAIQRVVEASHDGLLTLGPDGTILSGNESAELILDRRAHDLVGSRFDELFSSDSSGRTALATLLDGGSRELELAEPSGRWIEALLTDVGDLGYSFITCRDVTARATQTKRLTHDAHHDELTQLANRRRLMQELDAALDANRSSQPVSLVLVDLDDFKRVNDTLGHLVGDELLVALAGRLARLIRPSDLAVRLGGDEFAVLMRNTKGIGPARALAERISSAIAQPVQIGAATASVTASIGFTVGGPHDTDLDQMLHDADVALYAAKAQGKNLTVPHQPGLAERFLDGRAMSEDLSTALETGDGLGVVYQPIYELSNPRRLVGVEALCRWTHPTLGQLDPDTFVAAAEKSGRGVALDRFVRSRAMLELGTSDREQRLNLHVNLSAATLDDEHLVRALLEDSAATGFSLGRMVLEITEDVVVERSDALLSTLTRLREFGAKIALDDFGTGQATLSSLRWIPVDILKIDRSFVQGSSAASPREAALVEAVLKLGESLSLEVIAEGIESEGHLTALQAAGCTTGQGYLLGRPVEMAGIGALLVGATETVATA